MKTLKLLFRMKQKIYSKVILGSTEPTFQRRINVVSMLWVNVEITLSNVENETKSDVGLSTLHNVDTASVPDVETTLQNVEATLIQRCFNIASILVKAILNPIGLVIIMDLKADE